LIVVIRISASFDSNRKIHPGLKVAVVGQFGLIIGASFLPAVAAGGKFYRLS
jgi:hypothetical protein